MAEETKKDKPAEQEQDSGQQISEKQRFRYIGFDVFPGKPKDLFKSDADREKWVEAVKSKREKGEIIREGCTLMEDRVSVGDKVAMVVASLAIIASLFLPWFSVHNEIVEEVNVQASAAQQQQAPPAETPPGAPAEGEAAATDEAGATDQAAVEGEAAAGEEEPAVVEAFEEEPLESPMDDDPNQPSQIVQEEGAEQVILGHQQRTKVTRDTDQATALGVIGLLGDILPKMFGSGIALILTAVLMLVFLVACIAVPLLALYGVFAGKGSNDEQALRLKNMLRLAWIPPAILVVAFFLSFLGGSYNFDAPALYSSLGDSYSVGVFLGSMTYGIIVALGGFFLLAAKSAEI